MEAVALLFFFPEKAVADSYIAYMLEPGDYSSTGNFWFPYKQTYWDLPTEKYT